MTASDSAGVRAGRPAVPPREEWPFLAAGGVMGGLITALDWSRTPLGPIPGWPAHLRTAVGIMCESRHPMLIWWGAEFTMLYNDAFMDLAGTKHPSGLGRSGRDMFADIWDTIGPMLGGVLSTGRATWVDDQLLMMNRRGRDEETYWTYSYSPVRDAAGAVGGVFTATTDTTARVLGERRLRTLRELGEITAVTAPSVAQACTRAMATLAGNRADVPFASIHLLGDAGATAARAASYGMVDDPRIVPPVLQRDRGADQPIWAVLDSGHPQVLTDLSAYRGLFPPTDAPTGRAEPDSVVAVPLAAAGASGPVGVLFAGVSPHRVLDADYEQFFGLVAGQVSTAIADAAAYQAQRQRAEELAELDRAKTDFFTGVSHELRTPLTLITGPAEDGLADQVEPLPAGQRTRMELISRNGGRLRRLVDTLLEFSRLEQGAAVADRVAVDLAGLTRGIAESFAPAVHRAGLEFVVDCPELGAAVSVDVDMWEKIVLNLLSNAVKYTLAGRIGLTLGPTAPAASPGTEAGVELRVTDTGIGVPAAEQPRLFDRFHRVRGATGRSHEGSGIGLALVAELTGLHGGTVAVHSTPGQGSTFVVTLPGTTWTGETPTGDATPSAAASLYREEALQWSSSVPAGDEAAVPDRSVREIDGEVTAEATVLVAEDNPDLRQFVAGLLDPHYTVLLASDGRTALDRARTERPDLVLTDVMMPGLDGFALLAALRADPATAATPVILLSARAGPAASAQGLAAGADDYLVKPFSSHDLLARVRSNLAMARLRNTEGAWRTALVNALQDAMVVVDAAGRVIEINDAFSEVLGYGPEGLPYSPPYPWWPDPGTDPDEFTQVVEALAAAQASGGRFLLPQRHHDGRRLWVEASASTIADPHSDGPMIVGVFRDVTAAHRAEQHDRLLAETGRSLTRPGALVERLTDVVTAAAPVLADLAVVSLAGPDGRFSPVAAAHRSDPDVAVAWLALASHTIPDTLMDDYLAGRAFVLGEIPEGPLAQASVDAQDLAARRAITMRSSLIVPLVVAGRLLGSLTFVSTRVARVHDAADLAVAEELGRRVAGVVEAERVATREHRLHAATTALAGAASLPEAAAALADAVSGAMGAAGIAVYVTHPGDSHHLHLLHTVGYPAEVSGTFAVIRIGDPLPVADAARTRNAVWLGDQQAWLTRYPHMALPGAAEDAHAVAALPLQVGGQLLGVLAVSFPTARAFPDTERGFALTLVTQAAQAFERAALTDARWEIAQTLQRSLLPGALPVLSRLAVAVHYQPAGQHTQAGGDWYDVIALDADRVAIVVGDVVGNGPTAAAIMGQLRSTLGFLLTDDPDPARALSWLSRFARHVPGAQGSTAICLVLHTGTGELRWARAGHPPPLLLDPHATPPDVRYLDDAHGVVLGVTDTVPYTEGRTTLTVGTTVLLYTDGLVERRGEVIDDGLARLADATSAHPGTGPAALLDAVLTAALQGHEAADDVALVVARWVPPPLHQQLPARPEQLRALRRTVREWADATALPAEMTEDLQLALGEAVANSIEHAYTGAPIGQVGYRIEHTHDGTVRVEVSDDGSWRLPPVDPGYRGRGLAMITALGHDVALDTTGGGTRIRFALRTPPASPRPPAATRPDAPATSRPTEPRSAELQAHCGSDGLLTVALRGELDLTTIDAIRTDLLHHLASATGKIIIDTREVTYLASAGIGMLAHAVHDAPDRIQLHVRPGSPAARILALTGLDQHRPAR